jgi:hypothetical protein
MHQNSNVHVELFDLHSIVEEGFTFPSAASLTLTNGGNGNNNLNTSRNENGADFHANYFVPLKIWQLSRKYPLGEDVGDSPLVLDAITSSRCLYRETLDLDALALFNSSPHLPPTSSASSFAPLGETLTTPTGTSAGIASLGGTLTLLLAPSSSDGNSSNNSPGIVRIAMHSAKQQLLHYLAQQQQSSSAGSDFLEFLTSTVYWQATRLGIIDNTAVANFEQEDESVQQESLRNLNSKDQQSQVAAVLDMLMSQNLLPVVLHCIFTPNKQHTTHITLLAVVFFLTGLQLLLT